MSTPAPHSHARFATPAVILLAALSLAALQPCRSAPAAEGQGGGDPLAAGFIAPPDASKPWAYWWWLNGNVDERTITRDLEAMRAAGFGGLLMFDARGYHDDTSHVPAPPAKMDFMGAEWRRLLKFSLAEANRLGLEVSVNLSSCAGALKGPWDVGDDVPKKLVWRATELRGPKFAAELTKPEGKRFWDVAVIGVRHDDAAAKLSDEWQDVAPKLGSQPPVTEVVDLTAKVDERGKLAIDVPEGRWTLLRFGYMTLDGDPAHHGQMVTAQDVDILDPDAVGRHFDRMGRALLEDAGPLAGKTLTHFYSVSWEGAIPTWTRGFEGEYEKRRGYLLRPWLPALAGFTVKNHADSGRFLGDYYRTLGDCFRDNFYGKMRALCAQAGLKWHSESGGPWNRKLASFADADQLAFLGRNDMPQGEFWFTGAPIKSRRDMNRPQAMAAHIYGRQLAASEAFTHMIQHWSAYPAALKPFADSAFCDGVNHLIWHTFTASPDEFGKPGIEYFAGTHINPNVTWFPQARAFLDYLARCQFMLRQGLPVNDAAVYIGDKPYQHWGRGARWSEKATLGLPPGINYDLVSTEVLLDRLTANGGRLMLPEGTSYRMLIVDLDDETVPPATLERISKLRNEGIAVVLGSRKPQGATGLPARPSDDADVRRLADALWAKPSSAEEAMGAGKILPDYEGPFEYAHRQEGKTDIYFVSGKGTADCTFRVTGRQPELWDPVTGRLSAAAAWRATRDGRTTVALALPETGSVFVVFRAPGEPRESAPPSPPAELALAGPWNVNFGPKTVAFDELVPWNKSADADIRYFSGAATYHKTFELTEAQASQSLRLELGEVNVIARVRLNGKDLGVVWTAPWSLGLTGAAKAGRNELEITVLNTWVNRLIGDAALPPEKRTTKTNVGLQAGKRTFKAFQGFASEDPLMPSGLIGPVRIQFAERREIP
ncbi:MAG TPA: glycosyl hydrolase [Verrucomicrobiae bacterium]|nr:glycosyl hydrolase [Verrucomicrobiae bacterium]